MCSPVALYVHTLQTWCYNSRPILNGSPPGWHVQGCERCQVPATTQDFWIFRLCLHHWTRFGDSTRWFHQMIGSFRSVDRLSGTGPCTPLPHIISCDCSTGRTSHAPPLIVPCCAMLLCYAVPCGDMANCGRHSTAQVLLLLLHFPLDQTNTCVYFLTRSLLRSLSRSCGRFVGLYLYLLPASYLSVSARKTSPRFFLLLATLLRRREELLVATGPQLHLLLAETLSPSAMATRLAGGDGESGHDGNKSKTDAALALSLWCQEAEALDLATPESFRHHLALIGEIAEAEYEVSHGTVTSSHRHCQQACASLGGLGVKHGGRRNSRQLRVDS